MAADRKDKARETPALDTRRLRNVMGEFATGVTVVTYRDADGVPRGATVNSFTSVSMDPPLVLVSVHRQAKACAGLSDAGFTVNILAANQLDLALHFAGKPNPTLDVPWVDESSAAPRLRGTSAWIQCRPWQTYDGGDHVLVVGEVVCHDSRRIEPLMFHQGDFRRPGLKLFQLPRTRTFDGSTASEWVGHLHTLHALMEAGIDGDPTSS